MENKRYAMEETEQSAVTPLIMAGDSNTANDTHVSLVGKAVNGKYYLAGSQVKSWVWSGKTLKYVKATFPHEGYSGRGIAYLSAVLPRILKKVPKATVLLNIGANDMWVSLKKRVPINDKQAKAISAAWCNLAASILKGGGRVVAVLPTTPRNCPRPLSIFRAAISSWAKANKQSLVDAAGCANDGVHFTNVGYSSLAKRESAAVLALV